MNQGHLRGVADAVKHRLGGEQPGDRHAVDAADELVLTPTSTLWACPIAKSSVYARIIGRISQVRPRRPPHVAQPRMTPAKSRSSVTTNRPLPQVRCKRRGI